MDGDGYFPKGIDYSYAVQQQYCTYVSYNSSSRIFPYREGVDYSSTALILCTTAAAVGDIMGKWCAVAVVVVCVQQQ